MDINFNGFTLGQLFTIEDVRITTMPEVSVQSKSVPSRHGTIFQGSTIGERTVEVDIALVQDYINQFTDAGVPKSSVYNNYIRSIIYYCQTDEPCKLVVSDEPDRYLWAICTGIETERLYNVGKGTITFLCNDPYYYETTYNAFTPDADGTFQINNYGTAPAYPKAKINVNSDMTYLALVSPESVVQLGDLSDGETASKTYTYSDNLKTMNNWYYGGQALCPTDCQYDSEITCTCTSEVMIPALVQYGEGEIATPYKYKGANMISNFPTKNRTKYFQARLQFDFASRDSYFASSSAKHGNQKGAISIALMDINNNVIARCGMYDSYSKTTTNVPYIKLGETTVWTDVAKQPTPTVKKYTKVFESEDDLPHDAYNVDSFSRDKGYEEATINYNTVTVRTKASGSSKVKTTLKNKIGTKYRVKSKNEAGTWVEVWLNSARTSSGWIYHTSVTVAEAESDTVYTYQRKIYPEKNVGKYCDWWGYFMITRKPHKNGKGDIWTLEIWRLQRGTGKATRLATKTITDTTGTKYTHAGEVAKVSVFMGSRDVSEPVRRTSFNYVKLTSYADGYEDTPEVIASAGDVIEIDYSVPEVTLNGEPIMQHIDIGSRFNPLQPFMQTEMQITSDAFIDSEIDITNRYL